MITVDIKFMLYLESAPELAMGKKIVPVELNEGSTFGDLLEGFAGVFGPELAGEVYDPATRSPRDMVRAIINGVLAHNFDGTDTVLRQGDTIIFVPLVMGG